MSVFKRLRAERMKKRSQDGRTAARGNGNRAVWRDLTVTDGALYVMPDGQVARASVVPHPDALPQYWDDVPGGGDKWPHGSGLTLNVRWHEDGVAGESVGPALVRFMSAPFVAGVPWAPSYTCDQELGASIPFYARQDEIGVKWRMELLREATPEEEAEFEATVRLAGRALKRLMERKRGGR